MTEPIICPTCNVEHETFEKMNGETKLLLYKCPINNTQEDAFGIAKWDNHWNIPNKKRMLIVIKTPIFHETRQAFCGNTLEFHICCHQMKWQQNWNRRLTTSDDNYHAILYDPNYYHENEEYNGKEIDECPFCGAETRFYELEVI